MPETASLGHVLSESDSQTRAAGYQDSSSSQDDAKRLEKGLREDNGIVQESQTTHGHGEATVLTSTTNGHVPHPAGEANGCPQVLQLPLRDDGERPAKRQRTRDPTPPPLPAGRKPKPISPPWKKIEADGPTTILENGRRKSGRINSIPLDLQLPDKERTKSKIPPSNGTSRGSLQQKDEVITNRKPNKMPTSTPKKRNSAKTAASASASKSTPKRATASSEPKTTRSLRRRSLSPAPQPTRHSTRSLRTRILPDPDSDDHVSPVKNASRAPRYSAQHHGQHQGTGRSPRIRLKIHHRSGEIPLVHPGQVRKRPRIAKDFDDFWQRSGAIPVEEGGLLTTEDGPIYTDEMARKDAQAVLRIEREAEPGGLLSSERCLLFAPEGEEESPRQWARQDHMVRAMVNLRKLMLAEQQRHKATAKRLAEACREEWIRRQPKSAEEMEAEEREKWVVRFRVVVKTLAGTWDNVRIEVNRQRMERWEVEEQKRVKAALNQAVSLSEQKLQARQLGLDSELASDDDDDDDDGFDDLSDDVTDVDADEEESEIASGASEASDDKDGEDSDVMSSDEEEEEDEEDEDTKHAADEDLTQEQLRAKYANIMAQDLVTEKDSTTTEPLGQDLAGDAESRDETSDESIDMDDDLGSSEMDEDDDDDDDELSDNASGSEQEHRSAAGPDGDDGDDEEASGLLGLLFGKSELKELTKREASRQNTVTASQEDVEMMPDGVVQDDLMDDEDAISLIHHPDSINGKMTPPPEQAVKEPDDQTLDTTRADSQPTLNGIHPAPEVAREDKDVDIVGDHSLPPVKIPFVERITAPPNLDTSMEPDMDLSRNGDDTHSQQQQPQQSLDRELAEIDGALTRHAQASTDTAEASPAPSSHKIEVPFLLRGTLREYQRQGLDWLAGLYANNTNGILADEMGLGKTIQTIALLAHLACEHEVWGPHLVIVPTSVMLNWEMEFKKWCPGFKILAYYGSQEERKRKRQGWNNDDVWNVCVTSYQLVLQDQQVFRRRRWHYMILDEAHNIKNFKSQRWQTLLGFNTHSRLLLTGTPLQNNLTELWSLLFFLMPSENGIGGFADLSEFHDWFRKPESQILENGRDQMDDEAKAIIGKLHKVLRPYLLRRLKADVEKQMPAKYEHVEFCRLSKRQRELYDGFLARSDTRDTLASGNYLSIINCLMQLRKVCNHPDLFVDRPIMTSFRMQRSVAAEYEPVEGMVRRGLAQNPMSAVNLGFVNLIPTQHEHLSTVEADSISHLSSHRALMELREAQKCRAQTAYTHLDASTVASNIAYLESAARWERFEELQHCVYLNALRRQQRPIYGKNVVDLLTIGAHERIRKPRPKVPQKMLDWFESDTDFMRALRPSLDQRAESLKTTIEKFCCVTPAVVTRDLNRIILGRRGVNAFSDEDLRLSAPVRWAPFMPKQPPGDPWHEARMRLTIQFPDKRLLQYDCGKLQALDGLLRRLQAGGHRALIFTQMTKVLDILEQFLNIHGHKYLRLDGATKVEQRQILTDRFNHDPRILCFILSTRSGGLGINLTGADTVIFYDQDWNPAMDKQCQDRCHRIGQTRNVHIYRLVSEHTIEANILRKASQKQMLDDVVIQEGEFTTDSFNRLSVRDVLGEKGDFGRNGVAAADAALDLVLGGGAQVRGRAFEQAEDQEDVDAARVAEKEIQADDADFTEKAAIGSGASTTRQGTPVGRSINMEGGGGGGGGRGTIGMLDDADGLVAQVEELNAWGAKMGNIDDYMLLAMMEQLKHTKLELPRDKKKKGKKKGKDTRKR